MTRPLLGADFLRSNSLLVDLNGKRLLDAATFHSTPLTSSTTPAPHLGAISTSTNQYDILLAEFPTITTPKFVQSSTKHGVEHFITTKGPPVHARARRLPPDKLAAAKSEFTNMESMGIIRRSSSPWASPLHMVPKSSGGWRPSGDYRRLNDATVSDRYPVPHVQDFSNHPNGMHVFAKIDLVRGYHQIPVAAEDVPKTAIITPFGLFEFLRMPFGAAQAFQRLMDTVCHGLEFAFVYIDDILVAKEFVGMVNFYRRFIPAAAQIMSPLFEALTGKPKPLVWNEAMVTAFQDTKKALADATLLVHPRQDAQTSLTTDASDRAVGAVLQQFVDGAWVPLAFFSKKLRPPEMKYSAFDRELLALYLGLRHFRYFLEGRQFIAFLSPFACQRCQSRGQISSSVKSPIFPSLPPTYDTYKGQTIS